MSARLRHAVAIASLATLAALTACEKKPSPTIADPTSRASTGPAPTGPAPPLPAAIDDLAAGSNELAFDLYGRIRTSGAGNLAISPASISAALAMTYGGARGETADQMKATAHFAGDPASTSAAWGELSRALTDPRRPMKLRLANRLFGEKAYSFDTGFLEKTRTAFDAPLEILDFKHGPDAARARINGWVEERTERRIKDLLPSSAIDADTRLVLVNAIYFLADWQTPFEKMWTRDEPFHLTTTTQKKVPTMNRTDPLPLAKHGGATVVALDYKGGHTAMWVVVPDAIDGLAEVEKTLSGTTFASMKKAFSTVNVALALPRFEVNPKESLSLGKELRALGMAQAFEREKANFTGIANPTDPRDRLFIANVFHKAFVKTDEKGTEAAAATAVDMAAGTGAPPQKPVELKVDRPFLYFIVDKASSLVLFMGRVTDPTSP